MRNAFESNRGDTQVIEVDFGPIPENPSNTSEKDIKVLEKYYVNHQDQFPSSKYIDVREWENWRNISIQYNENNNQWTVSYNRFSDGEIKKNDFDTEQEATTYFNEQKQYNKQIALDLIREARNFAIGEDLDTPWTNVIDVSSETPTPDGDANSTDPTSESQAGVELGQSENVIYNTDTNIKDIDAGLNTILDKYLSQDEINTSDATTAVEPESVTTPAQDEINTSDVTTPAEEEQSVDTETPNPEAAALQAELDRLIEVESQKLQREENTENIYYQVDREKLENFKGNARRAITNYQQFATEHSSPLDKSNPQIQERYQLLEKQAWNSLYSLAHLLDGEIATLPQDSDIQLSHPEGVDIRQYLEARGYKFDEKGDITHINDNGVDIELNRAMKTDSLIKSSRPSRILYDKSISLDSDMNYQGYLVRGLNPQTPDFIVGVLDKEHLKPVIVDETLQSNNLSEGEEDPWVEEEKGATEFDKIFADSLKYNNETQISDEMSDPWVKKSLIEETPIMPVSPIPSGDNPDLQSEGSYPLGEEGLEDTPKVSLDDLRLAYAKAEEAWNRKRGDEDLKNAFELAREAYNEELERVLKLQVVEGQESNIHQMFKDEVIALRESRTTQSQELQGVWEQRLNPIKEKFVNFVIKNKKFISRLNLAAGVAGGALALTGAGIPLAGGLAVARRMVSATLLGVSTGEGMRSLGEDADINSFWGKIKFQAIIPKLVQESLASSEDEFKKVSEDILKERLGTLEAYYRLNGGKFTNDNQQQAYEKVLTELARRVQKNVIYAEQNQDELQSDWQEQKPEDLTEGEILEKAHHRWDERNPLSRNMRYFLDKDIQKERNLQKQANENWKKLNPEKYTSELLNTISDKRVAELDKFRRNRKIATGAGIAVGLLAGGAVHIFDEVNKTDSVDLKDVPGAGPGGAGAPDAGEVAPPEATPPPAPELPSPEEALRQVREAAATAEQAQELARDVSSLDSGETIWGEIAEQLGENASQGQIQQAVENYLQSELGQESIYKLAQGTEGGRALLAQWGIDNADAMASLSKDQLFEISRYLAPGELEGITELSIDNLDALSPAEYVELSPVVEPTVESASTEPPAAPSAESPVEPSYSELPPVETTEFTRSLSEALGTTNLTEAQLQEVIHSFATSEQGSVDLYNQIISNEEGARFLSGFGVNNPADFTKLTPDQIYEIAQTIGVENLDQLQGFELNEIILSKFEDAPDMVELVRGTRPLDVVQRYIANEVGSLPYDTNLGKQVLDTYLQTDSGKQWLYDSIVSNPNPNNQNVQLFREYLSFKGIKSVEDFKELFNWAEFSGNRNIPTSGFWNQIRLPNGGTRLQPLSTFLQPSQMLGIKDAVRQVLTR